MKKMNRTNLYDARTYAESIFLLIDSAFGCFCKADAYKKRICLLFYRPDKRLKKGMMCLLE